MARDSSLAIDAHELVDAAARLRAAVGERAFARAIGAGNQAAVEAIVTRAKENAAGAGNQARAVANDAAAFHGVADRDTAKVVLNESTSKPHDPRSFAFGSEFGAKHDVERTVGVRKVAIGKTGLGKHGKRRNVYARDYSGARSMLGWNQFQPWRGSGTVSVGVGIQPGYWLYPAIRDTGPIVADEIFGPAVMAELRKALDK